MSKKIWELKQAADAGVLELELTVDLALGTLTEAITQRR